MKDLLSNINIMKIVLPIIYILIAIFAYEIIKKIIYKVIKVNKKNHHYQRVETVRALIVNIVKYIIVVITLLAVLATFGVNVNALIAGLSVTTAIIGLAFQDLAKDLIAGVSIITEAQYDVGDTIQVGTFMGEVEAIGLKTTRIRDFKGATKIIANRYMDDIINYSLHDSLAIVDVSVDYSQKSEKVEKVLKELAENLSGTIPDARGEIEILGINSLEDSSIVYRVTLNTKPMAHYAVQRILRREIKEALDQIEVHHGKQ